MFERRRVRERKTFHRIIFLKSPFTIDKTEIIWKSDYPVSKSDSRIERHEIFLTVKVVFHKKITVNFIKHSRKIRFVRRVSTPIFEGCIIKAVNGMSPVSDKYDKSAISRYHCIRVVIQTIRLNERSTLMCAKSFL